MRLGAVTMLEKPVPVELLEREVRDAIADAYEVEGGLQAAGGAGLVGISPAIRQLFDTLVRVAPSNSSVLIQGESGTGKELVAQAVHRLSRRALGPLVAVNCAAIPEQLLESELFGHVKGAFTGASQTRQGRFRLADGGTVFLDEIGEMPLALQGKLLRVLQERAIEPVGGSKPESVDFRLIAATNKDLEAQVAKGAFRGDLFYRLNVVPLILPPLRERRGDVPLLTGHFLARHNAGKERPLVFSQEAIDALERHPWPGNVRELENLVERLALREAEIAIRHRAAFPLPRRLVRRRSRHGPRHFGRVRPRGIAQGRGRPRWSDPAAHECAARHRGDLLPRRHHSRGPRSGDLARRSLRRLAAGGRSGGRRDAQDPALGGRQPRRARGRRSAPAPLRRAARSRHAAAPLAGSDQRRGARCL